MANHDLTVVMMRRSLSILVLALGLVSLSLSGAFARCEGSEVRVRLAVLSGNDATPQGQLAKEIQTEFQRNLNGKWCVEFVQPKEGEAGSANVAKLRDKLADLALITLDDLSFAAPLHRVFELPFVFRDMFAVRAFLNSAESEPLRQWRTNGVRSLALVPFGLEQIGGRKALFEPGEMAGVRFALTSSQATRPMISRLRATSRVVAVADMRKAFEDATLDGQMARWDGFVKSGTSDKHAVFTQTNHALVGAQVLTAADWFGELKADDAAAIERSIRRAVDLFSTRQAQREERAMQQIMRSGKAVYLLTRQQRQEWRAALATITDSYAALPGARAVLDGIERTHNLP
ncbi:TRAP transporter substrate-binding protein [Pseudahrensia aquimaris]|uniref:TRAP transporter substrate-binding protein n=1 Tax=Pseudahrensia aquimaris TaxID=744461 RepID=A0ABW3FFZ8_9HYPH